jgi:hypothetical protein
MVCAFGLNILVLFPHCPPIDGVDADETAAKVARAIEQPAQLCLVGETCPVSELSPPARSQPPASNARFATLVEGVRGSGVLRSRAEQWGYGVGLGHRWDIAHRTMAVTYGVLRLAQSRA